jgi:hypothetical protein
MRIVVNMMNKTISTISLMGSGVPSFVAAGHLHELGQRLAGIFLDPQRPSYGQ